MNVASLFASFEGRINRLQFWIGTIVLAGVEFAIEWMLGIPWSGAADSRTRMISLVIGVILLFPTMAVAVKRLHDRDHPGAYAWLLVLLFAAVLIGEFLGYFDDSMRLGVVGWIAMTFILVLGLAFLIELGFRRGTPGPNQYGPDPLANPG